MKNEKRVKFGKRKALIFAVLFAMLLVSVNIGCASATISVCLSGCDYASIQAAVDAADSEDTIEVHSGTYYENVNVTQQLTLRGVDTGAGKPEVDAGGNGSAITLSADGITLDGFAVTNSSALKPPNHDESGIRVISNNNSIVNNNAYDNGGYGIRTTSANNNTVINNTVSNNFHGICLKSSSSIIVTKNTVNNNKNSGIAFYYSHNNNISRNDADCVNSYVSSNNNITKNNCTMGGFSLYHSHDENISGNILIYSSGHSWGIHISYSDYNNVSNNTVSGSKYGIRLDNADCNTITNNSVKKTDWGVFIKSSRNNLIYNNYFNSSINTNGDGNNVWNITKTPGTNIIGGNYLGGNYWSDYPGIDTNGDGFGDTFLPYYGDWFPLVQAGFGPPVIRSYVPLSPVKDIDGEKRTFTITVNQVVDVSWQINGTEVQTNTSVTGAFYRNTSAVIGTWNVSAIVSNENGTDVHTWIWSVRPSVVLNYNTGEHFLTIQEAIADPDTINGHTIEVDSGIYNEHVDVNKKLTLRGVDTGGGKPVVDADGSGSAITISANGCVIDGFNATGGAHYYEDAGIKVTSDNNVIKNNTAYSNNMWGISLRYSSNNILENNTALKNQYGLRLDGAFNNILTNNTAYSNDYGIDLALSSNNTLTYNSANSNRKCGIKIWGFEKSHYDNMADSSNKVNGKSIYYFFDQQNQVLDGWDTTHITLAYCSNFTIKSINISNGDGIFLHYSSNNTITDNIVSNSYKLVWLRFSPSNIITNNSVSNSRYGIYSFSSSNNSLTNNIASNNVRYGIYLGEDSNSNMILNNTCTNTLEGIFLYKSSNNMFMNNTASNNWIGIYLVGSNINSISANIVSNNSYGISLLGSSTKNNISGNTVNSNTQYGISLQYSNNNLIYNNHFNNTNNAWDTGDNIWNITKTSGRNIVGGSYLGGNYWNDYAGVDLEGDGRGDTLLPYNSFGNITNGGDWLPLVKADEEPYTKRDVGVTSNITPASPADLVAYLPPEYTDTDISDAVVLNVNVTDDTPDTTDAAYTDITINVGSIMDIETCKVFKTGIGFLPEVDAVTTLPTVSGEPAFSRDLVNKTITVRLYVGDPLLGVIPAAVEALFDTGEGTYPSIMGTHNGTIIPSRDINVSKMYTYSCAGTSGHSESIELYENETLIASGSWNGYEGDWHNITIQNTTGASYVLLLKGHNYNYTIVTGSYPQIIHAFSKKVTGGTIVCSSFVDANGKVYYDWIPAIRLE